VTETVIAPGAVGVRQLAGHISGEQAYYAGGGE